MTDAWSSIELDAFERIHTATGIALLRVLARLHEQEALNGPATLVIDDGERLHRLAPLPTQHDVPGELALSYSVSTFLLDSARAFSLELGDTDHLPLPEPTVGGYELQLQAPQQAIDELAHQLQVLRSDSEERLAQATTAQAQALARVAELDVEREAAQAIEAQLHARLAESTASAAQLAEVSAEREELRGELAQSIEALARLDGRLDRLVAELGVAAAARIDAERAVAQLQAEIATTREDRRQAEREAEQERVRALESAGRSSALETELAAAREATASEIERGALAQAQLESVRSQVDGLEREQADLTRRLDDLTERLAQAMAARLEAETAARELQSEFVQARSELEQARRLREQHQARADELQSRIPSLERGRQEASEQLTTTQAALASVEKERSTVAADLELARQQARELELQANTANRRVAEIEAQLGRSSVRLATLMSERHEAERQRRELATELEDARHALERSLTGAHGLQAADRHQQSPAASAPEQGAEPPLIDQGP